MTEGKPKGFAALTPDQRRELSRKGGLAVQAAGSGHRWTPEEASENGTKGARARAEKRKKEP